MDAMLHDLLSDGKAMNTAYNPSAFHLSIRENFVQWMSDLSEKLKVQIETYHHSVNLFDAYLMRRDIQR